jgi:hypothetical protein
VKIDVTQHEPVCAMHCQGPDKGDRWYYPDDVREARKYAEDYGARPVYPWRDSDTRGPVFPWTQAEVMGR